MRTIRAGTHHDQWPLAFHLFQLRQSHRQITEGTLMRFWTDEDHMDGPTCVCCDDHGELNLIKGRWICMDCLNAQQMDHFHMVDIESKATSPELLKAL